ncbi:MAG: PAS domain S-box protein [Deltaproteobacteria bacterium]|nr:PAS domain S-box protein [Deltaproteobacteria bacterium]
MLRAPLQIDRLEDLESLGESASLLGVGLSLVDPQMRVVWQNALMREAFPEVRCGSSHCFTSHWGRDSRCPDCLPLLTFRSGEAREGLRIRARPGEARQTYRVMALPVESREGEERWVLETLVHLQSVRTLDVDGELTTSYRLDASALTAATMVIDPQDRIVSWSPGAGAVLGYDRDEVLGRAASLLLPPEGQAAWAELRERVAREGRVLGEEGMRLARDGRLVPVGVSAVALRDEQGTLLGTSIILEDRSEVQVLQRQLDAQEQLLDHLLRDVGSAVLSVDPEGRITSWNGEAERLFGLPALDAVGRRLETLAGSICARTIIAACEPEGALRDRRLLWRRGKAEGIPVDVSAAPLRERAGGPVGVVAVVRDAREAIKLERQMLRSEKLAAVGSLAAGLAHEIGTPLNVISASAEYLMLDQPSESPIHQELKGIVAETERISGLVRELLTFARDGTQARTAVDVEQAVGRAVHLLRIPLEQKGVVLDREGLDALPPLEADADSLHQILINLLLNASEVVKEGGRISIRGRAELGGAESVVLEVHDDGPGVPDELRERVFDPFFSTRAEGTGLGLAVCARLVQSHGGDLRVGRSPLGGACFSVQLPVYLDEEEEPEGE